MVGREAEASRTLEPPKNQEAPQRKGPKLGQYQMGNIIGKGGFGSVYKALDPHRAHFVAIKQVSLNVLNSGDLGSIKMEISLLSKLKHRNIVKYIDSIRTDHHLNIVLEYIEGGSLASILKKFGAFIESLAAIYTLQILRGLEYLHSQGVIHRDIKGANVLTTKNGLVKLADFGVAMKLNESDSSKRRVVGTPYWMAPEIVDMNHPTPACDIWSVGSTVIEMQTEKPPYADLEQMSALYRIVSDPHPPLPEGITRYLESFLLLCFEKSPRRRPSASELLSDEWIEKYTRHKNQKASQGESTQRMVTPSPMAKEEEEEGVDDEEVEAIATLMNSIQQADPAAGDPKVEGASGRGPPPSRSAQAVRVLPVHENPLLKPSDAAAVAADAPAAVAVKQASAPESVVLADVLDDGKIHIRSPTLAPEAREAGGVASPLQEPKSIKLGDPEKLFAPGSQTSQNNFHFAFLDYYQKHYVAAEDPASARDPASPRAQSDTAAQQPIPQVYPEQTTAIVGPAGGETQNPDGAAPVGFHSERKATSPRRRWSAVVEKVPGDGTPMPPLPTTYDTKVSPGKQDLLHLKEQREAAEIKQLLGNIRPFDEPEVLVRYCKRLMELLQAQDSHLNLVTQYGAVPIVEMLQVTDPTLLRHVLKVVNQIVERNQSWQEIFATVGLIPAVIKFARPHHSRPLRSEAACFVWSLCNTSARSLQMLVACGGLEALVDLVSHDYYHNRDLVWLGLQALDKVFESSLASPHHNQKSSESPVSQKSDFCRILAKHGLCLHLTVLVDTLACDIHNRAAQYLKVVVNLLLLFAKEGDAVVKVYMAKGPVLEGLIASLEFLPPELTVQICKIFKWLAQEPAVLNMLENAGVVPVLVHFLSMQCGGQPIEEPLNNTPKMQTLSTAPGTLTPTLQESHEACKQCLLALHFLCKLSRPRQEQAALAGVVPLLQVLVDTRKDLREFAFAMICSMTCASLASRKKLWDQGGVAFLVRSLTARDLQSSAEEALVDWLGAPDWCTRVETELLQEGSFLARLLELFRVQRGEADVFVKFLDPLIKFVRISKRIKDALIGSDEFFQELLNRLRSEHKIGGSLAADPGDGKFNSSDGLNAGKNAGGVEPSPVVEALEAPDASRTAGAPASRVRRLVSEPAVSAGVDVRVRMYLMQLLLLLCEDQPKEQLAILNKQHRLQMLLHHVLQEEQRKQRVILCEIAQQLVSLFKDTTLTVQDT